MRGAPSVGRLVMEGFTGVCTPDGREKDRAGVPQHVAGLWPPTAGRDALQQGDAAEPRATATRRLRAHRGCCEDGVGHRSCGQGLTLKCGNRGKQEQ